MSTLDYALDVLLPALGMAGFLMVIGLVAVAAGA